MPCNIRVEQYVFGKLLGTKDGRISGLIKTSSQVCNNFLHVLPLRDSLLRTHGHQDQVLQHIQRRSRLETKALNVRSITETCDEKQAHPSH